MLCYAMLCHAAMLTLTTTLTRNQAVLLYSQLARFDI